MNPAKSNLKQPKDDDTINSLDEIPFCFKCKKTLDKLLPEVKLFECTYAEIGPTFPSIKVVICSDCKIFPWNDDLVKEKLVEN